MAIKYLNNKEIDREKWQKCIANDPDSLIYSNDWYLDIVSPGWEALVQDNYQVVFPLPIKHKFGLTVVNHPLFAQRLGISTGQIDADILDSFIQQIPSKFIGVRIRLKPMKSSFSYSSRMNYILPLDRLEDVQSNYNQNTKRNIKKSLSEFQEVSGDVSPEAFVEFKKRESPVKLNEFQWNTMKTLAKAILKHGNGKIYGLYSNEKLVSAVLVAWWKNRVYYLLAAASSKGKDLGGAFRLIDHIVHEFSGKGLILDFEGSMHESIARFFKGFGAIEEPYIEYKRGIYRFI